MSTKTTLKRIALVAVSALGFGVLTTVAPATAALGTGSTISSIVVGTIPTARVGETVTVPVTINLAATSGNNETTIVAVKMTNAPATALGQTVTSNLSSYCASSCAQVGGNVRLWVSESAAGAFPAATAVTGLARSTLTGAPARNARDAWAGVARPTTTNAGLTAASGNNSTNGDQAAFTYVNAFGSSSAGAAADTVYVSFIPDVSGSYSFLVSATSWGGGVGTDGTTNTNNPIYVSGDTSATATVTTAGAPTGVTLTNVTGTTAYDGGGGTYGALVRVNLTGGVLTTDEVINVTKSAGYISKATANANGTFSSNLPTSTTTAALTKADFVNGVAFVNVLPTAASQSITVTATGSGSLSAITGTASVASLAGSSADGAAAALPITSWAARGGTAVTTGWSSASAQTTTDNSLTYRSTLTSLSLEFVHSALDTDTVYYADLAIVDVGGRLSGAPVNYSSSAGTSNSLQMDKGFTATGVAGSADTYTVVSLTTTAGTSGRFTFNPTGTAVGLHTVTGGLAASPTSSAGSIVTRFNGTSASTVRAATGGSVVMSALVTDQFASALANDNVTVTVAGRNSARVSETLVTSSTGYVTTTITDSGTISAPDTVTFTTSGGATATFTINWGTFTVGTVTVTGGKTASDTYKGQNTTAISTAVDGPHGAAVSITATVKDADGNVLSGVPVTFTVSKGLVRKTSTIDYTTVYTGATGTAVTQVIDWTEGEQVITATAGGKTGTDYLTWEAKTAASARSISGTTSGNTVTATVKDRYGNTVKGVTVSAKTSAGYFGSGTNSTTGTTDADGQVSFFVTGLSGAANVTLSMDKDTYPESIDIAGQVGATAVTAAVAGTTVGTGASLSAAGVNSVVVAVTATDAAAAAADAAADAAAEAIDAANAATDAANLAAEAADAATVAAEEARDAADAATAAVEELATQVATLMAALKAQITTLANTVAKIAKKVKA